MAQGAAQYRNDPADGARVGGDVITVAVVAIVVVGTALAEGAYSAGAAAAFGIGCWWLLFMLVVLRLGPLGPVPRPALIAGGALLAFAALTLVSISWAHDDGAAYRAAVLAFLYTGLFGLVVVAGRRGSAGVWLIGLTIGLAGVCVLALVTRWFPGIHTDELSHALPDAKGRLSYPIGYWNALGSAMALLVTLLGWRAICAGSALWRSAATGFLVLPALTIFLTSSRGAVIASILGLLVLLAAVERRSLLLGSLLIAAPGGAVAILVADSQGHITGSEGILLFAVTAGCALIVGAVRHAADGGLDRVAVPRSAGRVAVGLGIVAIAAGVLIADPAKRWDHFKALPAPTTSGSGFTVSHLASGSGSGRYQFWSTAIDAFDEKPVLGIGAGGFEAWWTSHASFSYSIKNAHSLFIETMAELGLVGLFLILVFFGAAAVTGVIRLRAGPRLDAGAALAVLAAGVLSAGIDWTWQLPAVFGPVVVAAALLTGPASLPGDRGAAMPSRGFPRWRIVAAAASLLVVAGCGIQLLSSLELDRSQSETRDGDLAAAADDARTASAIEPWAGSPYLQLALVQEQAGDIDGALASIRHATSRDSQDWSVWLVRARLEAQRGNADAAAAALQRSRDLNPSAPVFSLIPAPG